MCLCGADEDVCENVSHDHPLEFDDEENEGEVLKLGTITIVNEMIIYAEREQ